MRHAWRFIYTQLGALVCSVLLLPGCGKTTPIQPASTTDSEMASAVIYNGESIILSPNNDGSEEFRVFHQGASGFVPLGAVRSSAEKRASDFCGQRSQEMKLLRETHSKPPHILGNFPRVELVFICTSRLGLAAQPAVDDTKYAKLRELKELLDSGALSQEEFDREKAKILNQH